VEFYLAYNLCQNKFCDKICYPSYSLRGGWHEILPSRLGQFICLRYVKALSAGIFLARFSIVKCEPVLRRGVDYGKWKGRNYHRGM
jgi:hypothetical protein